MRAKDGALTGWGRGPAAAMALWRPERSRELDDAFAASHRRGVIARGAGRAYGDAAVNAGGAGILSERLDRILAFDAATGEIVAEPGVTIRDLVAAFVPHGFMPPAPPGTAFATLGGAIAADVHGKNHDRHGSFGEHVAWLELLTADGATRRISPDEDAALFAATIGGMGLTGMIRRIAFRMLGGAAPAVRVRERRVRDLDEHLRLLFEARDTACFSVGWVDALARGSDVGRGILETAEFAPDAAAPAPPRRRAVPLDFPGFALNPLSIRVFNFLYARRVPAGGREVVRRLDTFLFPLDAIHDWNRIYGKRGFYQFQCVVPDAEAPRAIRVMLETVAKAGRASFLAVLKTLGGEGQGMLSFPIRGVTLALDFPRVAGIEATIATLNREARDSGGRVYLAKDALLAADDFRAMYPRHDEFEDVLQRVDPDGVFTSSQARRLGLKPARPS
jgi:decaprenylphospho-beta-D-ribofuranose 2-oxidase